MTKASDNAFPSVLVTEGTEPAAPAAGKQRLYVDSTTHHLKRTDSAGADVDIETASSGIGNHGAAVYNSVAFALTTSGTLYAITFDTERWDTDAYHSTGSNTDRLTVPAGQDGLYLISGHVRFAANVTGIRQLAIYLNGTAVAVAMERVSAASASITVLSVSTVYSLVATDYVVLGAVQTSGGALNAEVSANYTPEFRMQRVA